MIYCCNETTCEYTLRAAQRQAKRKPKKYPQKSCWKKKEWREEDKERDMLGRLNVVWGYGVIKTSCLGSFSVLVRAADTNSRGIKYKP